MQQAAEPWAHWVTITDCNGTRMFKFVELRRTRREVLSIKMQLGALVVTSRRTFDIFDCQANKPIAGLTSPIGLQTFGRRLQEREEGNMDDRKRLSKLGAKARLRGLTRKAVVYLHMRQLLSTCMAIGVWWGGCSHHLRSAIAVQSCRTKENQTLGLNTRNNSSQDL